MPEEAFWEGLFSVDLILDRLGIDSSVRDVAELGCGYGTFTLPVADRISGQVDTFDIDPDMVARTRQRAHESGLSNIVCRVRDVFVEGFIGEPGSKDACLLFNILHCEEPVHVLTQAAHAVRPGGMVHVIHWRVDIETPRGPGMDIRPGPEKIMVWARETGLLEPVLPVLDLPPWHYGVRLERLAPRAEVPT